MSALLQTLEHEGGDPFLDLLLRIKARHPEKWAQVSRRRRIGLGNGCKSYTALIAGGGARSSTLRSVHYSPVDFRRIRAVYSFITLNGHVDGVWGSPEDTGTGGASTRQQLGIQCAPEFTYEQTTGHSSQTLTAIPKRPDVLTWNNGKDRWFEYKYSDFVQSGVPFKKTDWYDPGKVQKKNKPFAWWTTIEGDLGTIPTNNTGSNWIYNRYVGFSNSGTTSGIKGRPTTLIPALTDRVTDVQTLNNFGSTQSAYADAGLVPAYFEIEAEDGTVDTISVVTWFDSTDAGAGEGNFGPYASNVMGSAYGNKGIMQRYIHERKGGTYISMSIAQHGLKHVGFKTNTKYRRLLAKEFSPTHHCEGLGINDIFSQAMIPAFAASASKVRGELIQTAANRIYLVLNDGVIGATAPDSELLTTVSGECYLKYIGGTTAAEKLLACAEAFYLFLRDDMPGVPIIRGTMYADSSSNDFFSTIAGQTVSAGWGGPTSTKGYTNEYTRKGRWPHDGYYETEWGASNLFALDANNMITSEDSLNPVDPTMVAKVLTAAQVASTSASFTVAWAGKTNEWYACKFDDGTVKVVSLVNGSVGPFTWTGAVTAGTGVEIRQAYAYTWDGKHKNGNGYDRAASMLRDDIFTKTSRAYA